MLLKKIFWIWWRKNKSDSEFLSYNLMLISGQKFRALRNKKNKYSNSRVTLKFLNETQNHNPPPYKLNGLSLIGNKREWKDGIVTEGTTSNLFVVEHP
jgi:hypothetical protein